MTIECPKPLLLAVRMDNDEPRTHEENRLRVQDWGSQLCRLLHALDARITALEAAIVALDARVTALEGP